MRVLGGDKARRLRLRADGKKSRKSLQQGAPALKSGYSPGLVTKEPCGHPRLQIAPPKAARVSPPEDVDVKALEAELFALDPKNATAVHSIDELSTPQDRLRVRKLCEEIAPKQAEALYEVFWDAVGRTRAAKPAEIKKWEEKVSPRWYDAAWYYVYPKDFGTDKGTPRSFWEQQKLIDHCAKNGAGVIYMPPHYEAPVGGDGGYDPKKYETSEALGGEVAHYWWLKQARAKGINVVTDAVFNHTSSEHEWFKKALAGDEKYINYFIHREDWKKISEETVDREVYCTYENKDGVRSRLYVEFPDLSEPGERSHLIDRKINGKSYRFLCDFYPFQPSLNLRNPDVLQEIFDVLGRETNMGVLGKRADAVIYWMKRAGTNNRSLPEDHALVELMKTFLRNVSPAADLAPEAVRCIEEVKTFAGKEREIAGKKTASEGSILFNFHAQGRLRLANYFRTASAFWDAVRLGQNNPLPGGAVYANLLGHHDDTFIGLVSDDPSVRFWIQRYIEDRGGLSYKGGFSAGGNYGPALENNPRRIANAIATLYFLPGVPVLYAGTELGTGNNHAYARKVQKEQHEYLASQGIDLSEKACFDPRNLQRGPIDESELERAESKGYEPLLLWRKLNEVRAQEPSLRSQAIDPVRTGHDDVIAALRTSKEGLPLIGLINLRQMPRTLRIPKADLPSELKEPELTDLLSGRKIKIGFEGDYLVLTMPPESRLLLKAVAPKALEGEKST